MDRNQRVSRSFVVQVADLIFHIEPNILSVTNGVHTVQTEITGNEIDVLQAFAAQAKSVVSPIVNSEVVYSIVDGPQKISLIKKNSDYMLVINSQIQFTTKSEEIYHEALVMPAFGSIDVQDRSIRCLILGGGDGLAAKQIFKHHPDTEVTLVDFDKNITDIFTHDPVMKEINEGALVKCRVWNEDAFQYVKEDEAKYDVIICDFPDPDTDIFNKLYSTEMYTRLHEMLMPGGAMVVQSGSLVPNSKCFPCIKKTIEHSGFDVTHFYTPTTYGELVYSLAKRSGDKNIGIYIPDNLKTMNYDYFCNAMMSVRPGLISLEDVEINTVDNHAALVYRLEELENIKK